MIIEGKVGWKSSPQIWDLNNSDNVNVINRILKMNNRITSTERYDITFSKIDFEIVAMKPQK